MTRSSNPLISIIIPCYNYGRYVGRAIRSVLNQSYSNLELVVVENGSTDNSLEVIRGLSDPRLKVIVVEKNRGMVPAWRMGWEQSQGEWIGVLSADDYFHPEKLAVQMAHLQDRPHLDVLGTFVNVVDDLEAPISPETNSLAATFNADWDLQDPEQWCWSHRLLIATVLYRRQFCDEAASLNDSLYILCDWDYHLQLLRRGARMEVLPRGLTYYRWHGANNCNARHQGLAPIVTEWVYSHALQFVPWVRERGDAGALTRSIPKFFSTFSLAGVDAVSQARILFGLLYPDRMLEVCPSLEAFKSISAAMADTCPEYGRILELVEKLGPDIAFVSESQRSSQQEELQKLAAESARRAAERDRAKEALARAKERESRLMTKLADLQKSRLPRWLSRCLGR